MNIVHGIFTKHHVYITMGVVVLVVIIIGYGEYRNISLKRQIVAETNKLASTTVVFQTEIKSLNDKITNVIAENNLLDNTIQGVITKNTSLADQIGQVNDTALTLNKLSKVDPQLLQKYSKIFFLNENYSPAGLAVIPAQNTFDKSIKYQLIDQVKSHLEKMFKAAAADGFDLKVASAYRSFGTQAALKSSYQVTYGAGTANQFSADQGYSEHQLGTTVDITTPDSKGDLDLFESTTAFTWLTKNAYQYGFVMSYPKNNAYYVYEPWHWRFVGIDLANRLHRQGNNFYDLEQRVINDYLSLFFD